MSHFSMNHEMIPALNRRQMLKYSVTGLSALAVTGNLGSLGNNCTTQPVTISAAETKHVYKIGAWTGNFDWAQKLSLDAVQISFSLRPSGNGDLRNPEVRKRLKAKSEETGVAITSLAMGEFNGNPFWEIDDAVEQVSSCIDAMKDLGVKQVLISYFGKGHINTDEKYDITIKRYRELAPKAEDAGVALAIEAPLNAEAHLRIIEGVNSPAIKVYYDPGNMIHLFRDTDKICDDIRKLRGQIVEAHCKDRTVLGKGPIDYAKILQTYREIGFFGTQVIEGSIDRELGYDESIRQGVAYMRSI
ncbi:MAG: sugar phosphate isomerase/epimerase family protein [Planctomycetia bacterium]|nr:sugar phosphate isomerase/epimerase family protein [Planctomycetia bacterium]